MDDFEKIFFEKLVYVYRIRNKIVHDAPWVWMYHPLDYRLLHKHLTNIKPNVMANNTLKYQRIDSAQREQYRQQHNKPIVLPLFLLLIFIVIIIMTAFILYRKREALVIVNTSNFDGFVLDE
jgi:oligopeptide transport system substrate-binding protein